MRDSQRIPFATIDLGGGSPEALISGVLELSDRCSWLTYETTSGDLHRVVLAWSSEQTTWNPQDETITFGTGSGQVTVANDDEVVLTGGYAPRANLDESEMWDNPPGPACFIDGDARDVWLVGDVSTDVTVDVP